MAAAAAAAAAAVAWLAAGVAGQYVGVGASYARRRAAAYGAALLSWVRGRRPPLPTAYYVIYNATVHTVDAAQPSATAFAVQNGTFVDVGTDDAVRQRHPDAEVVLPLPLAGRRGQADAKKFAAVACARTQHYNLDGLTVVPGLIDAHAVRRRRSDVHGVLARAQGACARRTAASIFFST